MKANRDPAQETARSNGVPKVYTPEAINDLPLRRYGGAIHLIRSHDEMLEALAQLRQESVLGFDTETRPAFQKGTRFSPALLQLAGQSGVYLFQINRIGFNEELAAYLADESILKAGVGLDYDIRQLNKLCKFKPGSFLDVSSEARQLGMKKVSLRSLAASFLGFRISKSAKCSNWAVADLKQSQIRYAATDAWVSREIYLSMYSQGFVRTSRFLDAPKSDC